MALLKLVSTLQEYGANILSGQCKFTLSVELLNTLNNSFELITEQQDVMNSSFHIKSSTEKIELIRNINFLQDFVKKTISLKLVPSDLKCQCIDISHFKSLQLLEVHKIDLKMINGLRSLRSQLEILICSRVMNKLEEIVCSADEECEGWNNLKELSLTHNNLYTLKGLDMIPHLHTLDLSHNELKIADELNCLINLKHLNLGYNKLKKIPKFTGLVCCRLQILVLSNNFIEDLIPIGNLINLRELDLTENCLIEHNLLVPLSNIATLQILQLSGNPMSYHPQHRLKTAQCLHENIRTFKFILDKTILNKSEQQLVGYLHPRLKNNKAAPSNQISLIPSIPVEKPRRIRNVTISDTEFTPPLNASIASTSSIKISSEHLDTKRQIEQLKSTYGDEWLHHQCGSLVQNVLGMDKEIHFPTSTPYGSADILNQTEQEVMSVTDVFHTASEETPLLEECIDTVYQNVDVDEEESHSEDENLGDGEQNIFLVTVVGKNDPVFLVITGDYLIERESTSTKEIARWPVECLETCESNENRLILHFDTLKIDSKTREYSWDPEECLDLLETLRKIILAKRELVSKAKQNIFNCFKCSSQFFVNKNHLSLNSDPKQCPTCSSELVFED